MNWNVDRNSRLLHLKYSLSRKLKHKHKLKLKRDHLNPLLLFSAHHPRQRQSTTVKHLEVHYGPSRKQMQISIFQCRRDSTGSSWM
jgi:hypothetical protein